MTRARRTSEASEGFSMEVAVYDRMCKTCEKKEDDGRVTVAPTGTAHLTQDGLLTLCGRGITWGADGD